MDPTAPAMNNKAPTIVRGLLYLARTAKTHQAAQRISALMMQIGAGPEMAIIVAATGTIAATTARVLLIFSFTTPSYPIRLAK